MMEINKTNNKIISNFQISNNKNSKMTKINKKIIILIIKYKVNKMKIK